MKTSLFKNRTNALTYVYLGLILFILYLFQCVNTFPSPFGLIPAVVVVFVAVSGSVFGEYVGCIMGFIGGLLCDTAGPSSYCFNLVVLTALGVACGLLSTRLFTKRFTSTLVTSGLTLLVYFVLHWLVLGVIFGNDGFYYLIRYSVPSTFYSALYVFPVYPAVALLNKRNA